ncbi:ExbD/TolR family protein [Sunxiuqinia sp. A32]|uniref:ExbD/TolR family protein n=1 Tax=Sunxiuqinia sp. A32 TaxID=3461496 RepID=UPI004045569C
MSKFRKSGAKELPPISTASLPDIVFMLLFFFMVSTTMREVTLMVKVTVPEATELSKLEKKSLVSYIYVGTPHQQFQRVFGSEPRIQLNDQFAKVSDIPDYITSEREAREEAEVPFMITSLKVDEYTKMGIVTDIKQELRKAAALHINYSSRKAVERE